jgi:outer membrane protein TolC
MTRINFYRAIFLFLASFMLSACQPSELGKLKQNFSQIKIVSASFFSTKKRSAVIENEDLKVDSNNTTVPLQEILKDSLANKNHGADFITSIKYALDSDPDIISKKRSIDAGLAALRVANSQKDFNVGTTLYGGVEDITDNTKGIALAINASRLVYDGGSLDSQIQSSVYSLEAAKLDLTVTIDQRANILCQAWLELEKFKSLEAQIDKRLSVLNPLIDQLEEVAKAGIGDVSKVTAAQRTVSAIKLQKTSISEGLAQAKLVFENSFGFVDSGIIFDYEFVSNLVPREIDESLIISAPALRSRYAIYQSNIENIKSLKAKSGFDVGFEVRALRPFAGSEYGSDESIGLVGRKTIYNGGMLESEIEEAKAKADASLAQIKATHRSGTRHIEGAIQNIESMEKAILAARYNAKLTSDEIVHLRQQLIIGGSTLDSVLSAEARLYEAESQEIRFQTEKHKSELTILSSLGLLSQAIGF